VDLSLLRTFVTVHRAGSFTRAAALLGLSQPAVTAQIRALERDLGRPLFLRRARGVTPTPIGDELAHKAAPHLDALAEIVETGFPDGTAPRTLHLVGPPEFLSERALPALTGLTGRAGPYLALRAAFQHAEAALEGLAAGHHDLAITTARPRGTLLTATALCDEEHVLVAAPRWATRVPSEALRRKQAAVVEDIPVVEVHESLPLLARYWADVFGALPTVSGSVVVPDLRAVLACVTEGAGLAVLPRYLCTAALRRGEVVALLEPAVPPLRTYFLVVRTGTLATPYIARAHEWLLRAALNWS
jgi:DNA-binding transcriptional LysR family regulator